ncbi:MAG: OmpH family outer membrane protein [Flavobacteriales bacterium]
MNTLRTLTVLALLFPLSLLAQKFGYIDTDYILRHMPEYAAAQDELNRMSSQWQIEIEGKYEAIRMLEQAYQAEKILLTTEMRQRREDEIKQKRAEAQQMQKAKFGVEGELFQRREELIKPVQDALYTAIEELASQRGYMVVFDKSNQSNMLYTNPKFDLSDDVIKKLGYKPGDTIEAGGKDGEEAGGREGGASPRDAGDSRGGTVPAGGSRGGSTRGGETVKPR